MKKKDTFKYHFKVGNKIVHGGITTRTLQERASEHRNSGKTTANNGKRYNWSIGHIVQVGNKTDRDSALKWERENNFGANQN
tara:strand:+ start:158 stop:403 length:246 start_codon:yes stop_codon:yes gene_type:complete